MTVASQITSQHPWKEMPPEILNSKHREEGSGVICSLSCSWFFSLFGVLPPNSQINLPRLILTSKCQSLLGLFLASFKKKLSSLHFATGFLTFLYSISRFSLLSFISPLSPSSLILLFILFACKPHLFLSPALLLAKQHFIRPIRCQ